MTLARIVFPHQLFVEHLDAAEGTLMVLVEPDLFFRQLPFHAHKLVLHRAGMTAFEDRLTAHGFSTAYVESLADAPSDDQLLEALQVNGVTHVEVYDVVDDWLERDLRAICRAAGVELDIRETPGFLTTVAELRVTFDGTKQPRMQHFYERQRRRLDLLMDGDRPAGGRWSFDTENRRKLPRGTEVPELPEVHHDVHVREALDWVRNEFPDNVGNLVAFIWPTTHEQADVWLDRFLEDRFDRFGPYEDAIAADEPWLFHSVISPLLNTGLLDPRTVVARAVRHAEEHDVDLPSVEGFVRQVIGWREYMRASYIVHGRSMRTRNLLGLTRELDRDWWDGTTGLEPVDTVVRRVNQHGWCHHIERLMVLGNAMLLMRIDPDEVYEFFMTLFIDAYDWVMVPNVYAMSQFAAGELITTKPYVSGSNYLRKMSDFPAGDWATAWDALYWQFVADHRDGFAANPRSRFAVQTYDRMDDARKRTLATTAADWLAR
nr:Deoxyribodipyrimidine photo-lyase-related protein [uncultured bacterium]